MVWMTGAVEFNVPSVNQDDFIGNIVLKREDTLVLHGAVADDETGKQIPGALVALYARRKDGTEYPLCHTLSNDEGNYLLHVRKERITKEISAIILRVDTKYHLSLTDN